MHILPPQKIEIAYSLKYHSREFVSIQEGSAEATLKVSILLENRDASEEGPSDEPDFSGWTAIRTSESRPDWPRLP
jgi:hypothetical protein